MIIDRPASKVETRPVWKADLRAVALATPKEPQPDPQIMRAYLATYEPPRIVELRILDVGEYRANYFGYFDDPEKLIKAAMRYPSAAGTYITINLVDPTLLARAHNRLRKAKKRESTADQHIVRRERFPIDVDFKRPDGISATDDEAAIALAETEPIRDFLRARGWPEGVFGESGNGGRLEYRIDLPRNDGGLVQRCLQALAARFDTDQVKVDITMFNPSRISKLFGSVAGKGDHFVGGPYIDRPHRLARLLSVPEKMEVVPLELLEALAAEAPAPEPKTKRAGSERASGGSFNHFDLAAWIAKHFPEAEGPQPYEGKHEKGQLWELPTCPWNGDHSGGCAHIIRFESGGISVGCRHNSCQEKEWAWSDLRALVEKGEDSSAQISTERNGTLAAVPMDTDEWRDIPEQGYVGLAKDFADLYAEYTESPRPYLYFGFLTYLGALLSHQVTMRSALKVSPRLYIVTLGDSSETRKSSALGHVDDFFQEAVPNFFENRVLYGVGSAEGIAQELTRDPDNKIRPLLIHLDEFRVLVDKARPEGSILLPFLSTLFERTTYSNRISKNPSVKVKDGYLSLVAASTKETYASIWTPAFVNIGLHNRLWLVDGKTTNSVAFPEPIPYQPLIPVLGKLLQSIPERLVLDLDTEAKLVWENWYEARPATNHMRRLDTYGFRLMILLAISRGELTISADTVRRVCALLDHQHTLRQVYDPIVAETAVGRMEEAIRRQLRERGPLTVRNLRRYTNADRAGLWVYDAALRNLKKHEDIREDAATKLISLTEEG